MRRLQQDRVTAPFERDVVIRRHAVDADDVVAGLDQPLGHVEADEAGRSCHQKAHSLSFRVLRSEARRRRLRRVCANRNWRAGPIRP